MSSIIPLVVDLVDRPFDYQWTPHKNPACCGIGVHPHANIHRHVSFGRPPHEESAHPVMYARPFIAQHRICNQQESPLATCTTSQDGFKVCLDVEHFEPNEISVKTVDDTIVVEGKHAERQDEHGQIFRHFVRRYKLPREFNIEDVYSTLSLDSVLTIRAPPPAQNNDPHVREIKIQQTGELHYKDKQKESHNDVDDKNVTEEVKKE